MLAGGAESKRQKVTLWVPPSLKSWDKARPKQPGQSVPIGHASNLAVAEKIEHSEHFQLFHFRTKQSVWYRRSCGPPCTNHHTFTSRAIHEIDMNVRKPHTHFWNLRTSLAHGELLATVAPAWSRNSLVFRLILEGQSCAKALHRRTILHAIKPIQARVSVTRAGDSLQFSVRFLNVV